MYLNWDNTLATGISNIDEQHKELFKRLDQLLISMKDGKGKDEAIRTLNFLEEYVCKHFRDEEEIQKKYDYPQYNIQYKQHEEFKQELKELRKVFETKGTSALLALNIEEKMITWCKNHIMTLDKDLGIFLSENSK